MSLRKTILLWVTVAFVTVSAIAVATTYYFTEREANSLLDTSCTRSRCTPATAPPTGGSSRTKDEVEDRLAIQIWDAAGQLVFHTPATHKSRSASPASPGIRRRRLQQR